LQLLLLALGLFGPIELLPSLVEGGGLHPGHQQQDERGEGGIVGNFHIRFLLEPRNGRELKQA